MRILHIAKYFPPEWGGMESFTHDLALTQARMGHDVSVLAHTIYQSREENYQGIRLIRCPVSFTVGHYAPVALSMPKALARLLQDQPHILHHHCPNVAPIWALCSKFPQILEWQSDVVFSPEQTPNPLLLAGWRLLEKAMLHKASAIITHSEAYFQTSLFLQKFRSKCYIIPLGRLEQHDHPNIPDPTGDTALNFLAQKKTDEINILAVGRLSHYKGFDYLLKALAQCKKARLCLIGKGEEQEKLHAISQNLGLEARLHLAGSLSPKSLNDCMEAAQVLCLPSIHRTEAFGLVLLEAMQKGLPCIATSVEGSSMSTVVEHQVTGFLVPPANALALAQAIEFFLKNPDQIQTMGQAGRARFLRLFNMEAVALNIDKIYKGLPPL